MTENGAPQTESSRASETDTLVEVDDLKVHFPVKSGILIQRKIAEVKAVDGISFTIRRGETLGLVGESGCGKTTTGRALLQLYRPTSGRVLFEGEDLTKKKGRALVPYRRRMQMIFQDPYSSLDPRQSAGSIIAEPLVVHHMAASTQELRSRVDELFTLVGLDPSMAGRYPHEFSGGQRQRIGVARALALRPSFIVCDEAVSALDVSIQAQVINLLQELQDAFQLTYLFIAHDLSLVRHISDRIAVMYLGKIMELADRTELYENPLHPYTKALLAAVPIPDPAIEAQRTLIVLQGEIPSPAHPPSGCVFHTRCPIAIDECKRTVPEFRDVGNGHQVACLRSGPGAPFPET